MKRGVPCRGSPIIGDFVGSVCVCNRLSDKSSKKNQSAGFAKPRPEGK